MALLTTAAGLSVAIPAVAAHTLLERQLERLHHHMQDAATRVFSRPAARAMRGDVPSRAAADAPASGVARLAEAAGAD